MTGLHGTLPDAIRLDRIELRDKQGVWLKARGVRLDWSAWRLLTGEARVHRLAARQVTVQRLPIAAPSAHPAKPAASSGLPLAIDADHIAITTLDLGAPLAGVPARLMVAGSAHLRSLTHGTLSLALDRLDRPGHYTAQATLIGPAVTARVMAQEPAQGLISMAAHLPALGALTLAATLDGPRDAAALHLTLSAGPLRAGADGTIDLPGRAAALRLHATAPAMTPAPGIGWQSVALDATLHGPYAHPVADGTATLNGLQANGARIGALIAHVTADRSAAALTATAQSVELPAPNQALMAGGPLAIQAHIALDDPARPVTFAFQQTQVSGQGSAILAPLLKARLAVSIPNLAPIAAARGRDVHGHAGFTLIVARTAAQGTRVDLDAAIDVTGGADAPAGERGSATFGGTVLLHGDDISLSHLQLDGATVHLSGTASRRAGRLAADATLTLTDLHDLVPELRGAGALRLHLAGPEQDFTTDLHLTGTLGTARFAPTPITTTLHATGLPNAPTGHLVAQATLAGAPLALDLTAARPAGGVVAVSITAAHWKSAEASGAVTLAPGASLPIGRLKLAVSRLADLRSVIGRDLTGSLAATLDLPASGPGVIGATLLNAGLPGTATIARAELAARVTDPATHPVIAGTLTATGIAAGALSGDLHLAASGPLTDTDLRLAATLHHLAGSDAIIAVNASLDATHRSLRLARLTTDWHGETLSLAAPALLTMAPALRVDRLALQLAAAGATTARLDLAGTISPTLALTLSARDLTPSLAKPFAPRLDAAGTLDLTARLGGTSARPTGTVQVTVTGLHMRHGPAQGLPPADLTATATTLDGSAARLDTTLVAGAATRLALRGTVPLAATGSIALLATGAVNLALLNPILTAQGRSVQGTVRLDATLAGTLAAPNATGTLTLAHGDVQDYAQGVHLTDIAAAIDARGDTIDITRLTARAGSGTLAVGGTIGLRGQIPVDLRITAHDAKPIDSDLVSATLNAALTLTGTARQSVSLAGTISIKRADIQVPDQLPASVAVLNVRRAGAPPPPPAGPGLVLPLDITLDAPAQIFVRGRGLDAELGGRLHIGGTAASLRTSGSIDLRYGTFSLAGTTLNFTSGTIDFNGARALDPALDLVATSSNASLTATLTVGGYASAPTITLSSAPSRPQDEILAALLFNQSAASLSPLQMAEIGAALAQLTGIGGSGLDPLGRLRKGLGLDRLSVGSTGNQNAAGGQSNTTTTVEGGKYVARGVYLGAKQGVGGAATQAELQINLTKRLKLDSDVGSGPGANNLGLSYQFQY